MVVVVVSPADLLNAHTNDHDEDAAAAAAVAATADGCVTAAAADADANVEADEGAGAGADATRRRRGLRVGVHATPLRTPPPDAIATAVLGRGNDNSKHASLFTTFMTCMTSSCTRAQLDDDSRFSRLHPPVKKTKLDEHLFVKAKCGQFPRSQGRRVMHPLRKMLGGPNDARGSKPRNPRAWRRVSSRAGGAETKHRMPERILARVWLDEP